MINFSLFVPRLRRLLAGLSPQRPGFNQGPVLVRPVVDKVALGQAFLRVIRIFPVSIIPPMLHTYFHLPAILIGRSLEIFKHINAFPDIWNTGKKSNFVLLNFVFHGLT
jgi:hypothetical protein